MKIWLVILISAAGSFPGTIRAADLTISGQHGKTYEGGTYGRLSVSNSSNITIRNCSFTSSGSGGTATIKGSQRITLDKCDLDGSVNACNCLHTDGSSDITLINCTLHDAADDGGEANGVTGLTLEGCTIAHLYGCGTDGGCGPCYNGHSDGIELINCENVTLRRNLIYDVRSTGAVFMGGGDTFCRNVVMENNIFYVPDNSIAAYIQNVAGVRVFNNIIWKGHWHGLAIGAKTTDLIVKNNIIRSIDFSHLGGTYTPAQHDIDYNIIAGACQGYTFNTHDIFYPLQSFTKIPSIYLSTTYTEVQPADFEPLATAMTIDAAWTGTGVPATDFYGNARVDVPGVDNGASGYSDIGPFEYTSTGITGTRSVPDAGAAVTGMYTLDGRPLRPAAGGRAPAGVYVLLYEDKGSTKARSVVVTDPLK